MSERYRFTSDTNRALFEDALAKRGAALHAIGWDVRVDDYVDGLDDLVREFGGYRIAQDWAYETTDSGQDAGLADMGAFSDRSNPDPHSRGGDPPDYSKQIVSQGAFPPRRATWSQPLPVPVAGINKRDGRR